MTPPHVMTELAKAVAPVIEPLPDSRDEPECMIMDKAAFKQMSGREAPADWPELFMLSSNGTMTPMIVDQ